MSSPTWSQTVGGAFIILSTCVGVSFAFWTETKDELGAKVDNVTLMQMIKSQDTLVQEIKMMREDINEIKIENAVIKEKLEDEDVH